MALYEITKEGLKFIPTSNFHERQIKEREDLQRLLKKNIEVLSSDLLVIAEEFGDWENSYRRIDLLAIDKAANLVVIELKRTIDGGHMELQALRYAAMVSAMTFAQACKAFDGFLKENGMEADAESKILQFLEWEQPDEGQFAQDVRIILASADFSKEITTTVMWLNTRGLDIRCYRMLPHDMEGRTILDIQQIIPLPEAEDFQVKVKEKTQAERNTRLNSERWDLDRILNAIRKNAGEQYCETVRDIFNWISPLVTRIWWSNAKVDGSFIPTLDFNGQNHSFFAIRSIGKVEIYLDIMAKKPPFDDNELLQNFIDRLNAIGAEIPAGRLYPKFSLEVISSPARLQEFKATIEWALSLIRGKTDEDDFAPTGKSKILASLETE